MVLCSNLDIVSILNIQGASLEFLKARAQVTVDQVVIEQQVVLERVEKPTLEREIYSLNQTIDRCLSTVVISMVQIITACSFSLKIMQIVKLIRRKGNIRALLRWINNLTRFPWLQILNWARRERPREALKHSGTGLNRPCFSNSHNKESLCSSL
jgi:hypothetical protein